MLFAESWIIRAHLYLIESEGNLPKQFNLDQSNSELMEPKISEIFKKEGLEKGFHLCKVERRDESAIIGFK